MKKIISIFLSFMIILCSFSTIFAVESVTDGITVYVTVSKNGEIVRDKEDGFVAMAPVLLSGQDTYNLDDAFVALHENLCPDGLSAYESAVGDYGLAVVKFWSDTSGNFTYQVNFGEESVWGLSHELENGDNIELCINQNPYAYMETYTRFDKSMVSVQPGNAVDLTLSQGEYGAVGLEFTACSDAAITVNGVITDNMTDVDGNVSLTFEECGQYVISAVKTKIINDETTTAIEAPVCIVTVTEDEITPIVPPINPPSSELENDAEPVTAEEQMHNIVEKYLTDSLVDDGNLYWFLADFADYLKIYPETQFVLTDTQKQKCIDTIIAFADSSSAHGDLAKSIIALRSLGYDAKNTYKKNGVAFNIVAKLNSLITEESVTAPYYEYTLPYVLMALEQGEDYATRETIDFLLNAAVTTKASWQDTTWGVDGAAPMLRALAPYCDTNADFAALIEETANLIVDYQGPNGSMGNASSTGLAIAGLAAVSIDPSSVIKNEKSLIDGLMSQTNETNDGFLPADNSFGTEQGLRGLIALKLFDEGEMIYDFKDYPQNEARATKEISPSPSWSGGGSISNNKNKDEEKKPEKVDEKPQSLSGKDEDVKILEIVFSEKTFEDIQNHKNQKAIEELAKRGIINGKSEKNYCPDETMTRAEFAAIVVRALGLPEKNEGNFIDVKENDWFKTYVNTAFSYGVVNGISENEFNPQGEITREEAATMVLRAAMLCGMSGDLNDTEVRNSLAEFSDYVEASEWAKQALAFCFNEEILDKSVIEIKPKTEILRAEIAQMLYNMLGRAKLV